MKKILKKSGNFVRGKSGNPVLKIVSRLGFFAQNENSEANHPLIVHPENAK